MCLCGSVCAWVQVHIRWTPGVHTRCPPITLGVLLITPGVLFTPGVFLFAPGVQFPPGILLFTPGTLYSHQVSFSIALQLIFWDVFFLNHEFINLSNWLASGQEESPCLCLSSAGIADRQSCAWLFYLGSRDLNSGLCACMRVVPLCPVTTTLLDVCPCVFQTRNTYFRAI